MAFISDNAIDAEITKVKTFIENLKIRQKTFSNTFHTMPPKDRARALLEIQNSHKVILQFIESSKRVEINNSGTKFSLENIKESYRTLMHLWRKTEKNLENFTSGSAPKVMDPENTVSKPVDVTTNAVEKYVNALKSLGQTPTNEMLNEFKSRLGTAYEKARAQSAGKNIDIQIVQEGSKIKVRMEPK